METRDHAPKNQVQRLVKTAGCERYDSLYGSDPRLILVLGGYNLAGQTRWPKDGW